MERKIRPTICDLDTGINNETLIFTIPHATFLVPTNEITVNDVVNKANSLLKNGIPVVPRDEGRALVGVISTSSNLQKVRDIFPNAVFGFSISTSPFCFSSDGLIINLGGLATITAYRARNQPPGVYAMDPEGNIVGEKGVRLRVVSDEELLREMVEESRSFDGFVELIEAARKNWPSSSLSVKNSDSFCLKVDVNDYSKLKNIGDQIPSMTGFFYWLAREMINLGIHVGEITGESILCYPERIEQIKGIKERLARNQCPWSLKAVLIGQKRVRTLYKSPSGVYPFVWPQTSLDIIAQTEEKAKETGRIGYGVEPL